MNEELIPGLPADVARECLTRVPFTHFPTLLRTSPPFKREILSDSFHSLRRSNGSARHVIAIHHADPASSRNYSLSILDPATATCHPLPPPFPGRPLPLFPRLVPVRRGLAIVGGWDPLTWRPTGEVHVLDLPSAAWRAGARMPGPERSFFGCAASDSGRVVVVAGGHDGRKDALASAMKYDVERDEWSLLARDMVRARDECSVLCLGGGLFWAVGGYRTERQGRFEKSAETLTVDGGGGDDDVGIRGPVLEEEFLESAACPRACAVGGGADGKKKLYMCADGHVAVMEEGRWRKVAELPGDLRAALHLVAWNGRPVVFGPGRKSGAHACYALEEDGLTWRWVGLPEGYYGHVQAACSLVI